MATHSVFFPGNFHGPEEPGELKSMESQRITHDWGNEHRHTQISTNAVNYFLCFTY